MPIDTPPTAVRLLSTGHAPARGTMDWLDADSDAISPQDAPFETLFVTCGAPRALSRHIARLAAACGSVDGLTERVGRITGRLGRLSWPISGEHRARLTALPDWSLAEDGADFLLQSRPVGAALAGRRLGLHTVLVADPRPPRASPRSKTTEDARRCAQASASVSPAEALFIQPGSGAWLLEGATWNLFAVLGETLCTPPLGLGIIPGVARAVVLECARAQGMSVEERRLSPDDLMRNASECFATNALLPMAPLLSLNGRRLAGAGPRFSSLLEAFDGMA